MHEYHNDVSDLLMDSHACHFSQSSLDSVIVYGHLVRLVAVTLGRCMLLRVLRLVGGDKV